MSDLWDDGRVKPDSELQRQLTLMQTAAEAAADATYRHECGTEDDEPDEEA